MDFTPGNVVRLKSSKVKMTVESVIGEATGPKVFCAWFEGYVLHRSSFPADALVKEEIVD